MASLVLMWMRRSWEYLTSMISIVLFSRIVRGIIPLHVSAKVFGVYVDMCNVWEGRLTSEWEDDV